MNKTTETEVFAEDEYEDWQYEQSSNQAIEFLDKEIFPKLDTFDFPESKDYVKGSAHYALFMELIPRLTMMGFSLEELIKDIEYCEECGAEITLH